MAKKQSNIIPLAIRNRIYNTVQPGTYNEGTGDLVSRIGRIIKNENRFDTKSIGDEYSRLSKELQIADKNNDSKRVKDLLEKLDYVGNRNTNTIDDPYSEAGWKKYLGVDNGKDTVFMESKHKPSRSIDPNSKYYSMPKDFEDELLNIYKTQPMDKDSTLNEFPYFKSVFGEDKTRARVLGNFKIGVGTENGKKYLSYYDRYDLSPTLPVVGKTSIDVIGNPFEIYNRIPLDKEYNVKNDSTKENGGKLNNKDMKPDELDDIIDRGNLFASGGKKNWIPKNLKKGRCTPMGTSRCPAGSPQYNLAKTFKKHHGFHENGGNLDYINNSNMSFNYATGGYLDTPNRELNYADGGKLSYNPNLAKDDVGFQNWYKKNTLEGQNNIPYSDRQSYDYLSFYKNKEHLNPEYNIDQHFPDTYKRPNHPTFSNESIYSTPENPGGSWTGEKYNSKGKFQYANGGQIEAATEYYNAQPLYTEALANKYKNVPIKDILQRSVDNPVFHNTRLDQVSDSLRNQYGDIFLNKHEIDSLVNKGYPNILDINNNLMNADKETTGYNANTKGVKESAPESFGYRMMMQRSYPKGSVPYKYLGKANGGNLMFLGGAVSGAATGASVGASLGAMGSLLGPAGAALAPILTGVGSLVGGAAGLIGIGENKNRDSFNEAENSMKERNQLLGIKANGGRMLLPLGVPRNIEMNYDNGGLLEDSEFSFKTSDGRVLKFSNKNIE